MENKQNVSKKEHVSTPTEQFRAMLEDPIFQAKFQQALGKSANVFIASLSEIYGSDKQLSKCDHNKIALEALKAASLKLPINKNLGYAYLLVFNNSVKLPNGERTTIPTPTMVIGYKGYIQLAQRTAQYKTINADVVYEGELKEWDKLSGKIVIDSKGKLSNKILGYFAYFELLNGFNKPYFVPLEEMVDYAIHYSPSFRGKNAPTKESLMKTAQQQEDTKTVGAGQGWSADFRSMALKVCLSQLLRKYGYLSIEMAEVFSSEVSSLNRDEQIANNANTETIEEAEAVPVDENNPEPQQQDTENNTKAPFEE